MVVRRPTANELKVECQVGAVTMAVLSLAFPPVIPISLPIGVSFAVVGVGAATKALVGKKDAKSISEPAELDLLAEYSVDETNDKSPLLGAGNATHKRHAHYIPTHCSSHCDRVKSDNSTSSIPYSRFK